MIKQRVVNKVFFCLLSGLLGFLGNWFRLELFFNVDYLIGSVFVMLAILMRGGVCGVVAGFIAATCSYFLWNHPWAIIIMTGEALFVALMYVRRKGNIVIYDAIYWLLIGMPLVYLFYQQVMHMPFQSTLLIMLKQSLNGILNSLMALTLYILIKQWDPQEERIQYSQLIFAVIATLVLLPAMLVLIIGMRIYLAKEKEALTIKLAYITEEAQNHLVGWINEHHLTIQTLATLVGDPAVSKVSDMQHYVETLKAATRAFYRMGIMNKDSVSVAYSPLEADGKSTLGVDFSDRPYISLMKEKRRPYVPDIVMGKLGEPTPIALLLAPIVVGGQYQGYAAGVINVKELVDVFTHIRTRSNSTITLVDGNWRVIASSMPNQKIMSQFARPYNLNQTIPVNEAFHWIPDPKPGTSIMQRWQDSLLVKAAPLSSDYAWKVVIEEPIRPIVQHITQFSIYGLGLLGMLTLVTIVILQVLSKGIVSTVVRLQEITTLLPERLADASDIAWPKSKIMELQGLSSNFQQMAASLKERQAALRLLNDELEQRVKERTADLEKAYDHVQKSEETLRFLASQLLTVQETERGRLSRELHDDLGQALLVLKMQLKASLKSCSPEPEIGQKLEEAAAYLSEIIAKVRRLSRDLSPSTLENLGLSEALTSLFEEFQKHGEHDIVIEADFDEVKDILTKEANIVIYRITQEFLANVIKHAEASRVRVGLKVFPDKVAVTMEDNGKGFVPEEVRSQSRKHGGMGLISMEERLRVLGSNFSLTSRIGQGTRLYFEILRTPGR